MNIITAALLQACIFFPMSLGVYLSSSILRITDLSADGSFLIGAAIFALLSSYQVPTLIVFLCVILGGASIGLLSSRAQHHNRIDPIIAGILVMFAAHSLAFVIMNGPNIGLIGYFSRSLFSSAGISVIALLGLFFWILSTEYGLALKTFGLNAQLLIHLGKNPETYRMTGLMLSNSLAALCGCLTAQLNGYADIAMGFGSSLIGIATVLVGKKIIDIIPFNHPIKPLLGCLAGTMAYFMLVSVLLMWGVNPLHLKGILALFLIATLRTLA